MFFSESSLPSMAVAFGLVNAPDIGVVKIISTYRGFLSS